MIIHPTLFVKPCYVPGTELGREESTLMKTDVILAAVGDRDSIIIIIISIVTKCCRGEVKIIFCVCIVFVW